MRRHVLVLWGADPIATFTVFGTRAIRVGEGPHSDVILPVESVEIANEGDTTIGRFVIRVTKTDDVALPPAPRRIDSSVGFTALSALFHATVIASLALTTFFFPTQAGADEATQLAAMKGYLARIEDRGDTNAPSHPAHRAARVDVDDATESFDATPLASPPLLASTEEKPNAEPQIVDATLSAPTSIAAHNKGGRDGLVGDAPASHADTGANGAGKTGANGVGVIALRQGDDWSGTYRCAQGVTDVVLHIDSFRGDELRGVFDFTHSPTGVHGSYRLHGRVDSETGEATLIPDEWIERPQNYITVGMHGRIHGKNFDGVITDESCGGFSLHRPT